MSTLVKKLISGGQTGVDRAALDVAIQLEIDHGGWCPRGRRAEDGQIKDCYQLTELDAFDYSVRTEKNVVESDGTLILHVGPLSSGTKLTWRLAQKHQRPVLKIELQSADVKLTVPALRDWIEHQAIEVLNVAGPRESSMPGICVLAREFLTIAFSVSSQDSG